MDNQPTNDNVISAEPAHRCSAVTRDEDGNLEECWPDEVTQFCHGGCSPIYLCGFHWEGVDQDYDPYYCRACDLLLCQPCGQHHQSVCDKVPPPQSPERPLEYLTEDETCVYCHNTPSGSCPECRGECNKDSDGFNGTEDFLKEVEPVGGYEFYDVGDWASGRRSKEAFQKAERRWKAEVERRKATRKLGEIKLRHYQGGFIAIDFW